MGSSLKVLLRRFVETGRSLSSEAGGAAMIEYALLVGLVALVAIVGVTATGTSVTAQFTKISCKIANPSSPCTETQ